MDEYFDYVVKYNFCVILIIQKYNTSDIFLLFYSVEFLQGKYYEKSVLWA